jgi:hypothetical protein
LVPGYSTDMPQKLASSVPLSIKEWRIVFGHNTAIPELVETDPGTQAPVDPAHKCPHGQYRAEYCALCNPTFEYDAGYKLSSEHPRVYSHSASPTPSWLKTARRREYAGGYNEWGRRKKIWKLFEEQEHQVRLYEDRPEESEEQDEQETQTWPMRAPFLGPRYSHQKPWDCWYTQEDFVTAFLYRDTHVTRLDDMPSHDTFALFYPGDKKEPREAVKSLCQEYTNKLGAPDKGGACDPEFDRIRRYHTRVEVRKGHYRNWAVLIPTVRYIAVERCECLFHWDRREMNWNRRALVALRAELTLPELAQLWGCSERTAWTRRQEIVGCTCRVCLRLLPDRLALRVKAAGGYSKHAFWPEHTTDGFYTEGVSKPQ